MNVLNVVVTLVKTLLRLTVIECDVIRGTKKWRDVIAWLGDLDLVTLVKRTDLKKL